MSKKLIAVAAAAALALTGLVATPATSAVGAFQVTVDGEKGGTGLTSAAAFTVNVPSQDVIRYVETATATTDEAVTASAVRVTVRTPGSTDVVRVTTKGGVEVLSEDAFDDATTKDTSIGSTSAEDAGSVSAEGLAYFVVYTTSTTASEVTVTSGSNSSTFWIKGVTASANAYNVEGVTTPTTVGTSGEAVFTVKLTDMFGNVIEADQTTGVTVLGQVTKKYEGISWSSTRKDHRVTVVGSAAGQGSVEIKTAATKIDAFGAPKRVFSTLTVGGTDAEQVTALTAQVAALTAQLANSVSKAKYNKLARKWNRANPSNKVKLQK